MQLVYTADLTMSDARPPKLCSMASTFKVPLAVQLLRRVDAGEISLDQMHTMQPGDYHPGMIFHLQRVVNINWHRFCQYDRAMLTPGDDCLIRVG